MRFSLALIAGVAPLVLAVCLASFIFRTLAPHY